MNDEKLLYIKLKLHHIIEILLEKYFCNVSRRFMSFGTSDASRDEHGLDRSGNIEKNYHIKDVDLTF